MVVEPGIRWLTQCFIRSRLSSVTRTIVSEYLSVQPSNDTMPAKSASVSVSSTALAACRASPIRDMRPVVPGASTPPYASSVTTWRPARPFRLYTLRQPPDLTDTTASMLPE